eukprot:1175803-Pyramimonas_sp.AAC.1
MQLPLSKLGLPLVNFHAIPIRRHKCAPNRTGWADDQDLGAQSLYVSNDFLPGLLLSKIPAGEQVDRAIHSEGSITKM